MAPGPNGRPSSVRTCATDVVPEVVGYSAAVQLSEIDTTFFAVSRVMSFSSCFCAEAIVERLLCEDDETPDELDELVLSESSDDELEDGDVDEDDDDGA
jgi:hypothetical protein